MDLAELERILVRFSEIPVLQPAIAEIDVNPLLASPTGLCALDARVLLHPIGKQSQRPAIRPYPVHYVHPWRFADGSEVQIRPIRPDDETAMVEFHKTLSDRSVYLRYFHMLGLEERIAHERLLRTCFSDYDREMVLVAEQGQSILAVGRLSRAHFARRAELSVLISDRHQGQGLGTEISRRLIEIARSENIGRIDATFLDENVLMRSVFEELGFTLEPDPPGTTRATLLLD